MKTFALLVLALAAGLVSSQVVSAQSYDFSFSASGVSLSGYLTVSPIAGSPGDYTVTSFTGILNGSSLGNNVAVSLDTAGTSPTPGGYVTSSGGAFYVDNQFYPGQNATAGLPSNPSPSYLDNWGLLLWNSSGDQINVWGNGNGTYSLYDYVPGQGGYPTAVTGANPPNVALPESGSFSMLILCGLGLAGAFLYKGRQSGFVGNS